MKPRRTIKHNCGASTLDSARNDSEIFSSQKRRAKKVKSAASLEILENTPVHTHMFRSRKNSLSTSSGSCLSSFITPLSSCSKDGHSTMFRSTNSSGYQSLKKSTLLKKNTTKPKLLTRKRLNISIFFQNANHTNKVSKYRLYQPTKWTNFLPPRALTKNPVISSSFELWHCMVQKESRYKRDPNYFMRQCQISTEMRSILIKWMRDVCDSYYLDYETLYLGIDYLDRYLSVVSDVPFHGLQPIGITCLYIAVKLHETVPPHIDCFATITDGACTSNEILEYEAHILLKINWLLQPVTPLSWLELFLQMHFTQLTQEKENCQKRKYQGPLTRGRYISAFSPCYFSREFLINDATRDSQYLFNILNTCVQDVGMLRFSYSVIAASILALTTDTDVFNITGYGSDEICACTKWLKQFVPIPLSFENYYGAPNTVLCDRTNFIKYKKSYKNKPLETNYEDIKNAPNVC